MAGRLLFRLLPALVASTGMTTFGEILSLRHGTSSRETPDIKDGITFPTLLTRDVAIRLLHGWPVTRFFFNILISFFRESHLIWRCRSRLSQLLSWLQIEFRICIECFCRREILVFAKILLVSPSGVLYLKHGCRIEGTTLCSCSQGRPKRTLVEVIASMT